MTLPDYLRAVSLTRVSLGACAAGLLLVACTQGHVGARAGGTVGAAADTTAPAGPLPLTLAPRPTAAAITARDLMTRIYIFADDSMQGREAGTPGNLRGNEYIVRELRRLGLQPAGENGEYFQAVPFTQRGFDRNATLTVDGQTLRAGADFVPTLFAGVPRPVDGVQAVFGGVLGDSTTFVDATQAQDKIVVLAGGEGFTPTRFAAAGRFPGAAAIAIAALEDVPPATYATAFRAQVARGGAAAAPSAPVPVTLLVSRRAAATMLGLADGAALTAQRPGTVGKVVRGSVGYTQTAVPSYNVVAVLPGSDPALRNQYVALGAHNDHVGFTARPVDHDSLKAFNAEARRVYLSLDAEGDETLTAAQNDEYQRRRAAIRVNVDSLRRLRPARLDSVNNGADDDGSGSMALLEIAENLAAMPAKPKRSVLFVWHTGEEKGLVGARWWVDHPTVPRDSVVAQLNIDMIGRGADTQDQRNGGPGFVGVIGARRLSTELGDLLDAVNAAQPRPLRFDGALDANGNSQNIYCRSDHYHYARYGIPVAFFFTGLHGDYHQPTDEPQYLNYPNFARVTALVRDMAVRVADLDRRVVVDKPKPDPNGSCRQ